MVHTKVMTALLEVINEGLANADGSPLVLLVVGRHVEESMGA